MPQPKALQNPTGLAAQKPLRIICVDDEADALANLRELLQLLGYEVDVAACGRDALRLASENAYDLALLDFRMPEMNGIELAAKLKALSPCMITMLVTAYINADQENDVGAGQEVRSVINKPLDIHRLAKILGDVQNEQTVLVVDDDRDLCQNLKDAFEQIGYRVCLAYDVEQAHKMLELARFRVVVVDYRLPGGDGMKLAAQVRHETPDCNVIMMTGFRNELADNLGDLKAKICYKPFDIGTLLQTARGKVEGA
jgi:two-component system sensor histidine kinase/response regulator